MGNTNRLKKSLLKKHLSVIVNLYINVIEYLFSFNITPSPLSFKLCELHILYFGPDGIVWLAEMESDRHGHLFWTAFRIAIVPHLIARSPLPFSHEGFCQNL